MEPALSCLQFQFLDTPKKRRLSWACVLCLPRRSSSGSLELDGCALPRSGEPSPLCGPSLSFRVYLLGSPCVCSGELVSSRDPPGGCQPSRISGSLWLETGSLFAVWWGCRLWGRVGPFPLPPASCLWQGMGRSAAGKLFSGIAQSFFCSANVRLAHFSLVNFLSPFCYLTV